MYIGRVFLLFLYPVENAGVEKLLCEKVFEGIFPHIRIIVEHAFDNQRQSHGHIHLVFGEISSQRGDRIIRSVAAHRSAQVQVLIQEVGLDKSLTGHCYGPSLRITDTDRLPVISNFGAVFLTGFIQFDAIAQSVHALSGGDFLCQIRVCLVSCKAIPLIVGQNHQAIVGQVRGTLAFGVHHEHANIALPVAAGDIFRGCAFVIGNGNVASQDDIVDRNRIISGHSG